MHSLLFEFADHSITVITPVRATRIAPRVFLDAMDGGPRLPLAIAGCAVKEEALIELWRRFELLDLNEDGTIPLPITQVELADGLGLGLWTVSRFLQELRRDQLIDVRRYSERQIHIWTMTG